MSTDDRSSRRSIVLAITGASGALYAVRTMAALLERGCHVEVIVSEYGRRLLRDELGDMAAVDKLGDQPGADRTARSCNEHSHRCFSFGHIARVARVYCYDPPRRPDVTDG